MPSPFPGMDPYLENSDFWRGFHNALVIHACAALQPLLPSYDAATPELRVYLDRSGEPRSRAGTFEHREAFIDIREVPGGQLVTSIEVLSPTNKRPGPGKDEYLTKQAQMLNARVNLVEIDLLRGGSHTIAVSPFRLRALGPCHYVTCTWRVAEPDRFEVIPWSVREQLPIISIPLGAPEAEVPLALQPLFAQAYATGGYGKLIQYAGQPDPPLAAEDAAWADGLLREAGLRGDPGA